MTGDADLELTSGFAALARCSLKALLEGDVPPGRESDLQLIENVLFPLVSTGSGPISRSAMRVRDSLERLFETYSEPRSAMLRTLYGFDSKSSLGERAKHAFPLQSAYHAAAKEHRKVATEWRRLLGTEGSIGRTVSAASIGLGAGSSDGLVELPDSGDVVVQIPKAAQGLLEDMSREVPPTAENRTSHEAHGNESETVLAGDNSRLQSGAQSDAEIRLAEEPDEPSAAAACDGDTPGVAVQRSSSEDVSAAHPELAGSRPRSRLRRRILLGIGAFAILAVGAVVLTTSVAARKMVCQRMPGCTTSDLQARVADDGAEGTIPTTLIVEPEHQAGAGRPRKPDLTGGGGSSVTTVPGGERATGASGTDGGEPGVPPTTLVSRPGGGPAATTTTTDTPAAENLVFEDSFSTPSGWKMIADANEITEYTVGETYRVVTREGSDGAGANAPGGPRVGNIRLEVVAMHGSAAAPSVAVGLLCRYKVTGDISAYKAEVDLVTGGWAIWRLASGSNLLLTSGWMDNIVDSWNQLKFECRTTNSGAVELRFAVNGRALPTVLDPNALPDGEEVGLQVVSAQRGSAEALFDDFRIWALPVHS